MTMSNLSEQGVSDVKMAACDKLLAARVDARIASNKVGSIMNRVQVFHPQRRDNVNRDICIPQSVLDARIDATNGTQTKPQRSTIGYAPMLDSCKYWNKPNLRTGIRESESPAALHFVSHVTPHFVRSEYSQMTRRHKS
jgi:hypothetical protein